MVIEKFDFKHFFDFKNRKIEFITSKVYGRYSRYSGVGAVSIITPTQAITRWTSIKMDTSGKLQLGGGHHISTATVLVEHILGKKIKELFYLTYDSHYLEENFLYFSIYIKYVNDDDPRLVITIPKTITINQEMALNNIFQQIKASVTCDISVIISDNDGRSIDKSLNLMNDKYLYNICQKPRLCQAYN